MTIDNMINWKVELVRLACIIALGCIIASVFKLSVFEALIWTTVVYFVSKQFDDK